MEQNKSGIQEIQISESQLNAARQHIIEKQFDGKFQPALKAKVFPGDTLTESWRDLARKSLRFASPIGVGMSSIKLLDLYNKFEQGAELSCYDVAVLNNNIETRTANDFGIEMQDYGHLLKDALAVADVWNEITEELRKEVIAGIEAGIKIKPAPEAGDAGDGKVITGKFGEKPEGEMLNAEQSATEDLTKEKLESLEENTGDSDLPIWQNPADEESSPDDHGSADQDAKDKALLDGI